MRVLVIKAHPNADSFCQALTEAVQRGLDQADHEHETLDLYASGFDPLLSEAEWLDHRAPAAGKTQVAEYIRMLRWAQALVFVYPTWWSGPPAILLGWMQRVFVQDVAFSLRPRGPIRGELRWIRRLAVVTTHGSPRWVNFGEGQVGRKQLLRGVRNLCHPLTRTRWLAMYKLDHSTEDQRRAFLRRVEESFTDFC